MRRKALLLVLLLGITTCLNAQESEIVFVDYEPDLCWVGQGQSTEPLTIDFDGDGVYDFKVYYGAVSPSYQLMIESWPFGRKRNESDSLISQLFGDAPFGMRVWEFTFRNPNWEPGENSYYLSYNWMLLGFRKVVDGLNYYAWAKVYAYLDHDVLPFKYTFYVDKYAYCPIPDYPLRWEQTCLNWLVDENGSEKYSQGYPNPTTGIFYIETGFEGTAEVAVYDTEGRRVLSRTTEGNTVEIDLGNQPAGLYYYSVANGDRRLSGKVMKK